MIDYSYDNDSQCGYIYFADSPVGTTVELTDNINLDYFGDTLVGMEFLFIDQDAFQKLVQKYA